MKVRVIQPPYSGDFADLDKNFDAQLKLLRECDEPLDLIALPESTDIPAFTPDVKVWEETTRRLGEIISREAKAAAIRCNSMVSYNITTFVEHNMCYNTTILLSRKGKELGRYYKEHPTPGEIVSHRQTRGYVYESVEPTIIEYEGIRFAFLTCYDFYFYEYFSRLAKYYPDVIIGCSHQRTDTVDALETMTKFAAYNTNAYIVRSSVTLGEGSKVGGCSMVVTPEGKILKNMLSRQGAFTVEFDPHAKYLKPAGYKGAVMPHHEYTEKGRRPWKYRPAGPALTVYDDVMPYPRVCAHRGFNTVAPENSLASYGLAVGMGAEEIEFDLWTTKDGQLVSCHDLNLERVSDGTGKIWDYTLDELRKFDFGAKVDPHFKGMRIATFEDILKKFACHCIMNIHVKIWDFSELDPKLEEIVRLIRKYDCARYVYFMSSTPARLKAALEYAPDICCCMGAGQDRWKIVDNAIATGCKKVQLFKPYFNQEMIDKAHAHGIKCNVFWSDDPEETVKFLDMGIDTILTNDYLSIKNTVDEYKKSHGLD